MSAMSLYSVVIPVFNSEHTLAELYQRIRTVFETTIHEEFELILVDDSSRDNSYKIMKELRNADPRVRIVQMAKNFGQHPALLCGFSFAKGDFIITMDDDLQHPPEEIPKLVKAIQENPEVDVIIAKYQNRHHNLIRKLGTKISVYATSKMLKKDPNLEITSFRLMRRFIVDAILGMDVHLPQIGNLLVQTSNRIINVEVRHDARKYGKSGYSYRRLAHDLYYDIISNSAFPLIVVRDIGIVSFLVSIVLGLFYLIKFLCFGSPVEGWTTIVLLISAYSGLLLLSVGIVGQYLINILEETRKMPNYTIRDKDV